MIRLSSELGFQVREKLNRINNRFGFLDTSSNVSPDTMFTEEELDYIVDLKIGKNDIKFLNYFKNLECIEIINSPSINDVEFSYIANRFNKLIGLIICNQHDLTSIDLSKFKELVNLNILNNDNLSEMLNINLCKKLFRISIFNNKSLLNVNSVYDLVNFKSNLDICEMDISYYFDSINYLNNINKPISTFNMITWIEETGYRLKNYCIYDTNEIKKLHKVVTDSISKYVFANDGSIEKFGIVYQWFVNNIRFLNSENPIYDDNVLKVFKTGYGSRLTYAKAFQFLLSFVDIDSDLIYSSGAFESIGMNNGLVLASLKGNSDYALLRIKIDGRHYYCDIAWNSLIVDQDFYENLRLVLVSADELKIRHNIFNEIGMKKSSSYSYKDTQELLEFASDRINSINNMFMDIEQFKFKISSLEYELIKLEDKIDDFKEYSNVVKDSTNDKNIIIKELDEYNLKRLSVIKNYKSNIVSSYLDIPKSVNLTTDDVNKYINIIHRNNDYGFISNYLCKIICDCLKDTK